MTRQKIIILATVFVDVLGFGIVIPILPFYLGEFGASPFTITLLFSIFSFCAFLSSPFLGALSDRIGRRPVILLSIFSTSIGWFVFASAHSIIFLFLGRIIDGMAAGNFTTAQSYLVDIAKDDKERITNLGIVGATFGIGFIVGPLVGALLSTISHSFPFYIAGSMALLNGISAIFFLTESNHHRNPEKLRYNPLSPLMKALKITDLRNLFAIWFLFCISFVIVQSIFALFTQKIFGYNSFHTGLLFTVMGVVIVINQAVLLNKFWTRRFTENQLEQIMLSFTIIGLLLIATQNLTLFYVALPFLGTSQAILRVVITNKSVMKVDKRMKGEIIGINASIMTVAMVIAPILGGFLFEISASMPIMLGALTSIIALTISKKFNSA